MKTKTFVHDKPYVFVVLAHHTAPYEDERVLGVYTTREAADNKRIKEMVRQPNYLEQYVSVLKLPLKGKKRGTANFLGITVIED